MSYMAIPGSNIRILRQQLGYSQRVLADAVGIDVSNLSRLESGRSEGSRETIEKIAKTLNVTVGTLYTEVEKVEAAVLRMRNVPVLSAPQIHEWGGPDSMDPAEIVRFLQVDLRRATRHAFAVELVENSLSPVFEPGTDLIFDPGKQPEMGSFVLAVDEQGLVHIGQLRMLPKAEGTSVPFEVVPLMRVFPVISSRDVPSLRLRGTLVESRRYHG